MPKVDKSKALLDAHTAWMMERLQGDGLRPELSRQLDQLLADGRKLKLKEVVSNQALYDTVQKYAVDLELGGRMPGLIGDVLRAVYAHPTLKDTSLQDLLPDRQVKEFIAKALEMQELREAIIHEAVTNPLFSSLIAELLYTSLKDYAAETGEMAAKLPGAKSAMKLGKAMMSRTSPDLAQGLEGRLKKFVSAQSAKNLRASEQFLRKTFETDTFKDTVLDLWDDHKGQSIASMRRLASEQDLEEIFVLVYELWKDFRKNPFFSDIVNCGIDTVLERFGDTDLTTLLADVGLDREMMLDDAMRFAPPVIKVLKKKKLLEPLIRRQFEDFYYSETAQAILAK